MYRRRFKRFRPWRRSGYRRRRGGYSRQRIRRIAFSIQEKKYLEYVFNPKEKVRGATFGGINTTTAFLTDDWNSQVSLLCTLQQGNSVSTRMGNRINVKYVQISNYFLMNNNPTGAGTDLGATQFGMFCRYMMLLDKQPGGTTLPRANMDTFAGAGAIVGSTVMAFRQFNLLRRFKVLLDAQHQRHLTGNIQAIGNVPTTGGIVLQHYVKINRQFTFTSTGSATDMSAADNMQDGDILYQCAPSVAACCLNVVMVRICFTDA